MRLALVSIALLALPVAACDGELPGRTRDGDVPDLDAGPGMDTPRLDAPGLDAPGLDGPGIDVPPGFDVPSLEMDAPIDMTDAPGAMPDVPAVMPDVPAPPSCPSYAGPIRPATCPLPAEVVLWTQNGWNVLADAIAANRSDCAEYWITIPTISGTTDLRPGEAAAMHARHESIHPMAEFHWGHWSAYRAATGASWTEIGHLFRQRMVEAGYCVESGDTWGINEAPTGARLDSPGVRAALVEATAALYEGMPGMPPARGAVFVINFGHGTSTTSVYKPNLENWLTDATFWGQMNLHVRFWSQEVYTDPMVVCMPGTTLATRSTRINEFTMHPTRLAAAAPPSAGAGTAETYLNRAYTPLLNAFYGSDGAYGNTVISLPNMEALISEQVYATRLWADGHLAPDGRIGFAFGSLATPSEWMALGTRLGRAIQGAYGRSASAMGACFEGASSVHCDCSVAGATVTTQWTALGTW